MPHFFVDESGNLGFVFGAGSSKFFIIVLLQVADPEIFREFVKRLRTQQSLSEQYEFKYRRVGSRRVLRAAFFNGLSRLKFSAWAIVVDKEHLPAGMMALDRVGFYGWAMGELIAVIPTSEIANSIMVIDDPTRSGKFVSGLRVQISRVLRGLGKRTGFRKITGHDAAREEVLQCADMIAGALADHVSGDDSWAYQQIAEKFSVVLYRPEKTNLLS
ncbi:MAG: DUF3800 domain-containing protein [Chloroflexota bacterium]